MYQCLVPETKRVRLIVNSDAKSEADDQFTIVHALLTPKFDIKGLIPLTGNGRKIRVYDDINPRFILDDMFSKLKLPYGE